MQHLWPRGRLTATAYPRKAEDTLGSLYIFHPRKGASVLKLKSTSAKMVTVWRHCSLPRWRRETSGTRFPNQRSPRGQAEETALGVQVLRDRSCCVAQTGLPCPMLGGGGWSQACTISHFHELYYCFRNLSGISALTPVEVEERSCHRCSETRTALERPLSWCSLCAHF